MKNKYFTYTTQNDVQIGIVTNIPDDVTDETIAARINSSEENQIIEITNEKFDERFVNVEFNWEELDK